MAETANEIIRDALASYGLEALLEDESLDLVNLYQDTADLNAVWVRVKQSPTYAERFPGMAALAAAGRAISEETYVALERQYAATMSMYGLPSTFYDSPEDFGNLIAGDTGPQEFSQRVALASEAAISVPAEVKQQLEDYYGITEQDLTAYYLDPERATNIFEERERFGAAQIGGAAIQTGMGPITRETAERISASGITETEARQGFQTVAATTLQEETASEQEDITETDVALGLMGVDEESRRKTEGRRQRRLAQFRQTGGPVATQSGYVGLGSAN